MNLLLHKLSTAWNILKFKRAGIKFGPRLRVSGHIGLQNRGKCSIGNHFVCTSGTMANAMARNVRAYICVGPGGSLLIGNEVGISSVTLWCDAKISIGDNVKIGALTIVTDTDAHSLDYIHRRDPVTDAANAKTAPVVIEDDAFIGTCCIICKGVTIGARSIVGAGSVVTKSIPPDEVWAGNPACFIKSLKA